MPTESIQPQFQTPMHLVNLSQAEREKMRLRDACAQFEGMLTGMILKEGLRNHFGDDEDKNENMQAMLELCVDHAATSMAQSSSLGVAEQMLQGLE